MRIVLLSALLASLLTTTAVAQHRAAAPAARPRVAPPVSRSVAAAPRPITAPRPVIAPRPYYPRTYVPYPVFIGGGYAYDPGYGAGYADPTPVAVVNQDFQSDSGTPTMVDYSNVPLPAPGDNTDQNALPDDQPTIFLIALTDHTVLAAIAYWTDGDTLNWVSRDAKQNHISLSLVDRDFSKQLNDERHVDFHLPAK